jgi:DNA polymerase I-like protein with 3'-5' exonuclease and polymerase domains
LELEDLSGIPEELRMAYKLMKNAGYTEEESSLRQEMMTIESLLKKCDDSEKDDLQKKLNEKLLRFNQLMSKRGVQTNSSFFKNYQQKVQNKLKI